MDTPKMLDNNEDLSHYNSEGTILRRAQLRMLEMLVEVDRICKKHNIQYWLDYGTLLGAVRHGGFIPWDDDLDISLMYEDYKRLIELLPKELPDRFVLQDENTDRYHYLKFARIRDTNTFFEDSYTHLNHKEKGLYIDIFPYETMLSPKMKKIIEYSYGNAFRQTRHFYKSKWRYISGCLLLPFSYIFVLFCRFINKLFAADKISLAFGVAFLYNATYLKDSVFPCKSIKFEGFEFMAPNDHHEVLKSYYGDYMQIPPMGTRIPHATKIIFK